MWSTGQTVLDRYTLAERLAEGGGGETWAAEGPAGMVAIKRIQAEDRRRFRDLMREASLLREIRHPHVVSYREFTDRPDEDCAILVTDFVAGGDLEAWIGLVGPRPVREVAALGLHLVAALEQLAQVDVLHRDLKPTNILVAGDGPTLRITDFGISRPLDDGVAQTRDRSLTPLYAAPEQHVGGPLTAAADLYALGGVLAFMATGQHPSQGGFPTRESSLDPLLERLMAYVPEARPSLAQTRHALEAIRDGRTLGEAELGAAVTVPPDPLPDAPPSPIDARRVAVRGALGAAALLVAGVGLLVASVGVIGLSRSPAPLPAEPGPAAETIATAPVERPPIEEPPIGPPPIEEPPPDRRPAPPAPSPREAAPERGTLFVNSVPYSTVFVDGEERGSTGNFGASFDVPTGVHTIRLVAGDREWEGRIEVDEERRLCVNLKLGTEWGCR